MCLGFGIERGFEWFSSIRSDGSTLSRMQQWPLYVDYGVNVV